MVPLLTATEIRALDQVAIEEIGIPSLVLMETAGWGVARAAAELLEESGNAGAPVLALAGLGNNGGDAVVAARHLWNRGHAVTIAILGDPEHGRGDLIHQIGIADKLEIPRLVLAEEDPSDALGLLLERHAIVIDGIFGTGLVRDVEGAAARAIDRVNASDNKVVAVDLPSGIHADTGQILGTAIRADATVTFALPKLGHALYPGRAHTGALEVIDIGIPYTIIDRIAARAQIIDGDIAEEALPARNPDSHKGTYGHLLVIAGTPDRPGSALLAGRGALRVGAGLVTIGSDDETIRRLAPSLEALMGKSLGPDLPSPALAIEALQAKTALAIGPSLEPSASLEALVRELLEAAQVPAVVDAGGLGSLGLDPSWLAARAFPTVLTPHPGEMARILGADTRTIQNDRLAAARELASRTHAIVVLKGASTVIADPDGMAGIVLRGNAGMATGGTGDVLTGVISGLLAQGIPASIAARAGAYLHGLAGDKAAAAGGQERLTATDLLEHLARRPLESERA